MNGRKHLICKEPPIPPDPLAGGTYTNLALPIAGQPHPFSGFVALGLGYLYFDELFSRGRPSYLAHWPESPPHLRMKDREEAMLPGLLVTTPPVPSMSLDYQV